jgi:hypothetical protein
VEEFETALRALTRATYENILGVQSRYGPHARIQEARGYPLTFDPQADAVEFLVRAPEQSQAIEQVLRAITNSPILTRTFLTDATGNLVTNPDSRRVFIHRCCIDPFLGEYLAESGFVRFDEEVFQGVFHRVMRQIERPDLSWVQLSPLLNLELEPDAVQIQPNAILRKLRDHEKERWLNRPSDPNIQPGMVILGMHCAVEICHPAEEPTAAELDDLVAIPLRLVHVLRLLTGGGVCLAFTEIERRRIVGQVRSILLPARRFTTTAVSLSVSNAERLPRLWDAIQRNRNPKLDLAFRRWAAAVDRHDDSDRLIDYWIGFESLFSPDDTRELRFRCALRIAAFLGTTPEERETIYWQMGHSYDWRSAVVHGASNTDKRAKERMKKGDLKDATSRTRDYLRRALLQILESGQPFQPADIERQLLGQDFGKLVPN